MGRRFSRDLSRLEHALTHIGCIRGSRAQRAVRAPGEGLRFREQGVGGYLAKLSAW